MEEKRTIEKILNIKTGHILEADYIFRDEEAREVDIFRLRHEIEEHIQKNDIEYVCYYCKQAIALRGKSSKQRNYKRYYFTHLKLSDDCIIKTIHRYTEAEVRCIKYNGEKESPLHVELKNKIGYHLSQDSQFFDVKIDQVYKSKAVSAKWRKPDILAQLGDKQIAFELQLSTTFLSVIVGRSLFYRDEKIFLIWIFPGFSIDSDLQKFTEKDVYYNNNFNVYVFDKEAQQKSADAKTLIMKCFYKRFYINYDIVDSQWTSDFIQIHDLKFSQSGLEVHYYDSDMEFESKSAELKLIIEKREKEEANERLRAAIKGPLEQVKKLYQTDDYNLMLRLKEQLRLMPDNQRANLLEALNSSLEIQTVLKNLFLERNKPNFLGLVREQKSIKVNSLEFDGILNELILMDNIKSFRFYLSSLFMMGYTYSDKDRNLLLLLSKDNRSRQTELQCDMLEKCAYASFVSRLKTREAYEKHTSILHLLYAVASVKTGIIVGSRLNNLKQVTNNFLQNHSDYGDVYLKALDVYRKREEILKDDKTGKIRKKIDDYLSRETKQETTYYPIINDIFPDLQLQIATEI